VAVIKYKYVPRKKILIGSVWPEPNSSAAGTRMLQLISLLKKKVFYNLR
jgi:hypothetical protein